VRRSTGRRRAARATVALVLLGSLASPTPSSPTVEATEIVAFEKVFPSINTNARSRSSATT
jgi:hypothetical protein